MTKTIDLKPTTQSKKIAIVVAEFNEFITKALLKGCVDELLKHKVKKSDITIAWVPGSFELPVAALKFAKKKTIHAVICLGAVIRGETYHFELVAEGAAQGIMQASLISGKPVILGVLSTETVDQAYKRSEEKGDNKGRDAARAALQMLNLFNHISR